MRMTVQFENGMRVEALILAANRNQIRVAVEGSGDAEEWNKVDGVWRDQEGRRIEIEAMIPVQGTDWVAFCAGLGHLTMAMGAGAQRAQ